MLFVLYDITIYLNVHEGMFFVYYGLPVKTLKENVYRPSIEIILISFHYCDRSVAIYIRSAAKYLYLYVEVQRK